MKKNISRRDFLKSAAAGTLGATFVGLTGCSPRTADTAENAANPVEAAFDPASLDITETIDTDILIVGSGASGIMAAYEAGKANVGKVLVISNSPTSDATNGGMVSGTCAVESSYLNEMGQEYTSKELYDLMYGFINHTVDANLLRTCVNYMPETIDIFNEMGIDFSVGGDRSGYGFLNVHLFETENKHSIIQAYEEENFGVEFRFNTEAFMPVMDGEEVVGVYATDTSSDATVQINAKAVVLACGGFLANEEEMDDKFGTNVVIQGTHWQTGKGIEIAKEAGAHREGLNGLGLTDIIGSNEIVGFTFDNPLLMLALYGNLLVDHNGKRFTNEYSLANASMSFGGEALLHVKKYYAIYSQTVFDDLKEMSYFEHIGSPECWPTGALIYSSVIPVMEDLANEAIENGWCWKADTIEELAEVEGLPHLVESVKAYDAMVEAGADPEYDKPIEMCEKIEDGGPYYLLQFDAGAFNTFGGCRTDEFTRALTKGFDVIPGLYIAGVENGSLYGRPYYNVGGTCSGLAYSSGRLAGQQAAAYVESL